MSSILKTDSLIGKENKSPAPDPRKRVQWGGATVEKFNSPHQSSLVKVCSKIDTRTRMSFASESLADRVVELENNDLVFTQIEIDQFICLPYDRKSDSKEGVHYISIGHEILRCSSERIFPVSLGTLSKRNPDIIEPSIRDNPAVLSFDDYVIRKFNHAKHQLTQYKGVDAEDPSQHLLFDGKVIFSEKSNNIFPIK